MDKRDLSHMVLSIRNSISLFLNIVFDRFFAGRPVNFYLKACRPIMSRSWDDLVDDSSGDVSPCDEVENGTLDLRNVSDELNAGISVAETSVSTPEDVCNRIKKNLTSFEKGHFSPKNVMPERLCSAYFRVAEDLKFQMF